ncbi:MAG: M20/M25/M40 family metallo-hydrolase [Candidatus Algichlamydia australiensis]|nr:M20/M25/M40 family metallo-hydrolase [Chlamydiales bacterium]
MFDYSKWFKENEKQIREDFFTFLRFPSVSTEPDFKGDVRMCANWVKKYLEEMGLHASLWEGEGHPVLFAETEHQEGYPTILLYHHYDVQPVDPLDLWESKPFSPTVRDGKVYARGACDNKGQCFYSITAVKAYLEAGGKCNIKFLIEGEEEAGSATLRQLLKEKQKELQCDHLIIVDITIPEPGVPAVTLGMRGNIAFHVECTEANFDLHSGEHGGLAYNPNRALAELLAKLWNEKGEIAIPQFYDDLAEISKEDLAALNFTFDEERYKKEFGIRKIVEEGDFSPKMRNWLRPTVEINGMGGGYVGEGFKTIIPAKASAKISCRLPPGLKPDKVEKQVKEFLFSHIVEGIELKVDVLSKGGAGYFTPVSNPTVAPVAKAYEDVFNRPCEYAITGGSIPIAVELAEASRAEPILMGVALATDQIHAPNEYFGLDRFAQGFEVMAKALTNFENE